MNLLDWDQFMERVEQNEALALELAEDLLLSIDGRLSTLVFAFAQGDLKPIEHASHALRGLISPYGGQALLSVLKSIEEGARSGHISYLALPLEISQMVDQLKAEVESRLSKHAAPAPMKHEDQQFM